MEPWYEDHVKQQKKFVKNRETVWRRHGRQPHQWKAFTVERNKLNRMLAGTKIRTNSEKILECGNDSKKLFNLVNNLTGRAKINPMPPGRSDGAMADEFAEFFIGKINKIRDNLKDCPTYIPTPIECATLDSFRPMTEVEVIKIIKEMPTKSCECDAIPTKLLKTILDKVGSTITKLVNISLGTGRFAESWKTAIVRPLLKKPGLKLTPSNYRPVSNLPFLSKLTEKCMLHQFTAHCDEGHLIPEYQSAYRKDHSCETALVKILDDILWAMERQRVTAAAAIDLSAAFDTVDHDVLLRVLDSRFGIKGDALSWFDSYLRPRAMKVNVGNEYSLPRELDVSVPQGSGAGPRLYSSYASTMKEVVPVAIDIHGYADDHALKRSFSGASRTEERITMNSLKEATSKVKTWMDANKLKMNDDKTELILFGSRQQLNKTETVKLDVNGIDILRSKNIKLLGADLDENLSFSIMINRKCRVAFGNLQKLRSIRKSLTLSAAKKVALGLVLSHLDYANALYTGLPQLEIRKLQRIQNMAAKVVTKAGRYDSSTAALKELHWLPIHLRIKYKIALLVFRCINGIAPSYLCKLLTPPVATRYRLRSQTDSNTLVVPFTKCKTFADRAFSVAGPKTWNDLPEKIRSQKDLVTFKKALKTHFFLMF